MPSLLQRIKWFLTIGNLEVDNLGENLMSLFYNRLFSFWWEGVFYKLGSTKRIQFFLFNALWWALIRIAALIILEIEL